MAVQYTLILVCKYVKEFKRGQQGKILDWKKCMLLGAMLLLAESDSSFASVKHDACKGYLFC